MILQQGGFNCGCCASMYYKTRPSLIRIIPCYLFHTKSSTKPMLVYCCLDQQETNKLILNTSKIFPFKKMHLKMLSLSLRPFYPGLNVLSIFKWSMCLDSHLSCDLIAHRGNQYGFARFDLLTKGHTVMYCKLLANIISIWYPIYSLPQGRNYIMRPRTDKMIHSQSRSNDNWEIAATTKK